MPEGMGPDAIQVAFEQLETHLKNFSRVLVQYKKALESEGFSKAEAMKLVSEMQERLVTLGK